MPLFSEPLYWMESQMTPQLEDIAYGWRASQTPSRVAPSLSDALTVGCNFYMHAPSLIHPCMLCARPRTWDTSRRQHCAYNQQINPNTHAQPR